jgi:hypothetical protein
MRADMDRRISIATISGGMLFFTGIAFIGTTSWSYIRFDKLALLSLAGGFGLSRVDARIRRAISRRQSPPEYAPTRPTGVHSTPQRSWSVTVAAILAPIAIGCSAGLVANTLDVGIVMNGLLLLGVLALTFVLCVVALSTKWSD